MRPSSTPNTDIELAFEMLEDNPDEEKIARLKKESDAYCSDCLTKKDKYYFAGAIATCECGAEDFKENGRGKYPALYRRWVETADDLKEMVDDIEEPDDGEGLSVDEVRDRVLKD